MATIWHSGGRKITLEDEIELFLLKKGIVIYEDIVSHMKVSDENVTKAVTNLVSDGKIIRRKGETYTASA
jgi:DNA-binding GntR family transcriptional regulator